MPHRSYEFVQLDVFTQTPLTGNPLAIFTDARGLDDGEMQALAREMNLSETTFILPRDPATETQEGKKVRIFTVAEELPFAGHPTLGTALHLYHAASSMPDKISLDLNVGKIDIRFRADSQRVSGEGAEKQHARRVRSPEGKDRLEASARMFFYGGEDPATGSAAGCAASWMVQYGIANSDEQVLIRQGVEILRPSEMYVRATRDGQRVTNVRVGGYAVEVLRGTVRL